MMLRTVGSGKSFFGCGTVTFPGLVACLNWWCEPTTCTNNHPSALSCLIISALFMPRFYTQIHNQPAFTQVLSTDCNRAVTPQAPAALAIMRPLKSMLLVERDGNDERGQRDAARPQAAGHPVALGVQHPSHLRHRSPDGELAPAYIASILGYTVAVLLSRYALWTPEGTRPAHANSWHAP